MSYQVLYRAWRPATFTEIVGQDAVISTLRRQVVTGRIAHAYLFCGTRGTGKTTASKVLSRAINCLDPHDGDPCGECEVCRAILADNCMDVVEIDAASNNGVDEIRDLRDKVAYPPSMARYKVYIIDEVHMLSTGAFNALLKTLEEPPAHAVFILATTEPQRLPATILSRCQRFDFHRIGAETIVGRLRVVLEGIGREADDDALYEIARAAEGGMRDALSLLDNCLSYTDSVVTLTLVRDVLGSTGRGFLFDFMDALIAFDAADTMARIEALMDNGSDPTVFVRDLTAHLRGLLLAPLSGDIAQRLEITQEDAARFDEQSKRISVERVTRLMDLFIRAESDMKWASRPRTVLELAAMRACHPEDEADAGLNERLDRLEAMLKSGAALPRPAAKPAAAPPPKARAQAQPAKRGPAAPPPEEYLEGLRRLTEENASLKRFLSQMQFASFEEGLLSVEFDKSERMSMNVLEKNRDKLEDGFSQAFGQPVHLNMQVAGAAPASDKTDPEVRKTLEMATNVFPREIITVTD